MAPPAPFFPYLTGGEGLWTVQDSAFADLASQLLGNAGTDADGFDSLFAELTAAVDALGALLDTGETLADGIIAVGGVITSLDTSSTDAEIARVLKAVEATSSPIGTAIAGLVLPTVSAALLGPPPAAPPVGVSAAPSGGVSGVLQSAGSAASTILEGAAGTALGAGVAAGGGASALVGGLLPLLTNPVTIIVGVVALVGILAEFIGKGCGQACIESAKLEQVYEVAADLVAEAVTLGMLPFAQWVNIYQAILQHGQQAFAQLESQGDKKAAGGLANMQKVLASIHPVAPAKTTKYNWQTVLLSWLAMTNPGGWYPDSLQAGENLAQTTLAQVLTN